MSNKIAIKHFWSMIDYYGTQYIDIDKGNNIHHFLKYEHHFGRSVPTEKAVKLIIKFIDGNDILEVGAGLGLWAYILQLYNVKIYPTDIQKPFLSGIKKTHVKGTDIKPIDSYKLYYDPFTEIEIIEATAAIKKYKPKVLMLVWPDIDSGMSENSIKEFKGDKIIFIGEKRFPEKYTRTASTEFYDILEKDWIEKDNIEIPHTKLTNDSAMFFVRK